MDRFLLAMNPMAKEPKAYIIDTFKGYAFEPKENGQMFLLKSFTGLDNDQAIHSSMKQAERWYRSYLESKKQ